MYNDVGVRYKGFSSVSINNIKNPFNIKLDYIDNKKLLNIKKTQTTTC